MHLFTTLILSKFYVHDFQVYNIYSSIIINKILDSFITCNFTMHDFIIIYNKVNPAFTFKEMYVIISISTHVIKFKNY